MEPRGIRNNNPLNIKRGNKWQGLHPVQSDPVFDRFLNMDWGCRAACVLAKNYITGKAASTRGVKRNTVESFIRHWCPDATAESYIKTVCKITGYERSKTLDWRNKGQLCYFLWAMARVECGRVVPLHHFENGYGLAFGKTSKIHKPT